MNKNFKNISAIALATSIITTSAIAGIVAPEAGAQGATSGIGNIFSPPGSQASEYELSYEVIKTFRGDKSTYAPKGVFPKGTTFKETGAGSIWTNVDSRTGAITVSPRDLIPAGKDHNIGVRVTYPDGSTEVVNAKVELTLSKQDFHRDGSDILSIAMPVKSKTYETTTINLNEIYKKMIEDAGVRGLLGSLIDLNKTQITDVTVLSGYDYGFITTDKDKKVININPSGNTKVGIYETTISFKIGDTKFYSVIPIEVSQGNAPAPTTKTVTSEVPAPKPTETKPNPEPKPSTSKPTTTNPKPTTGKDKPTTTNPNPTTSKDKPTTEAPKPTTGKDKPTTTTTTTVVDAKKVFENKFEYQPIDVEQGRTVAFLPRGKFATGTKFEKTKESPKWFSVDEKTGRVTIDQSKSEIALGDYKAGVIATYPDGKKETKEVLIKTVLKTDGMGKNTYQQDVKDVTIKAGQSVVVHANLKNDNIPERVRQIDVIKNFIPVIGNINDVASRFGFDRTNIPTDIVKGISLDGKILISPNKNVAPGEYTVSIPITKYNEILGLVSNLPLEKLATLKSPEDLINNPELVKELMTPEAVGALIKLMQNKDAETYYADFTVTVLPYDPNDKEFNNDAVVMPKPDKDKTNNKTAENKPEDKGNKDKVITERDNRTESRSESTTNKDRDKVTKNNKSNNDSKPTTTTTQKKDEENLATTGVNSSQIALAILALLSVAGVAAFGMRRERS